MTKQINTYGKCPQCGGEGLTSEPVYLLNIGKSGLYKKVSKEDAVEIMHHLEVYYTAQPNAPVAVSGEPYGWVIDCKPEFIEDLNYEERNFFVEDKNQLSYYIGTEDEPSMYDITPLYLSPPQPQSVKDAFRLGILYASQKYEVVRNEHFTGGDVADFLFMEEGELDDSDIESEIRKLIGIK